MCGIYGCVLKSHKEVDEFLEAGKESLFHRGPDKQSGVIVNLGADYFLGLGINRLAITDIENGHQPMTHFRDNIMVYNGEVFNYQDLVSSSLQVNPEFVFKSTNSDTESLYAAYSTFGDKILNEIRGMFSFCFFDSMNKTLDLAVDHLSIKDLVFYSTQDALYFSSEIKFLSNYLRDILSISKKSCTLYLQYGFVPNNNTIFNQIKRIPPGCLLRFKNIGSSSTLSYSTHKWFRLSENEETEISLDDTVEESIALWGGSDLPVSSLLSAGIDSSLVTSVCLQAQPVSTYSFGYVDKHLQNWSEIEKARSISDRIKSNHHEVLISQNQLFSELDKSILEYGEPHTGPLPMFYLFQEIGSSFKVTMTGHGGDELFGSYGRQFSDTTPAKQQNLLVGDFLDQHYLLGFNHHLNDFDSHKSVLSLFRENPLASTTDPFELELNLQLPSLFLRFNDIYSSMFSVEARTPLLDQKLIRSRFKNKDNFIPKDKANIRARQISILEKYIDKNLLLKKKRGLTFPYSFAFRHSHTRLVIQYLLQSPLYELNIVNHDSFTKVIKEFMDGSNESLEMIWRFFTLSYWLTRNNFKFE